MAVSFGTRKALGRRYGQDPALALELERLEKEYSLIPSREARAFNEKSLAQQQSQYEQNRSDAKAAGITGTIANLGTTAALYRGMTKAPGEPFFANPFAAKAVTAGMPSGMTIPNFTAGYTPASSYASMMPSPGGYSGIFGDTVSVNPALVDSTAAAGLSEAGAAGAAGTSAASVGFVPGMGQALALYTGSRMAGGALEGVDAVPKEVSGVLKHPVTGMVGEPAKLLGKATGIKEIGNIGGEIERIEDQVVDFITDPFGSLGDAFGW